MMKMISDSLANNKADTITKIQTVEMEKKLSWWDQLKVDAGTYVMFILLIGIIVMFFIRIN
jgi:hypothetical protein